MTWGTEGKGRSSEGFREGRELKRGLRLVRDASPSYSLSEVVFRNVQARRAAFLQVVLAAGFAALLAGVAAAA